MNLELINSINTVSESIIHLENTLRVTSAVQWWDTQWFSAVIGASAGFIGTQLFSTIKNRNKNLSDYYQWLLEQGTFSDPDGLLKMAISTSYVGTKDKSIGEKMVIGLRSHIKYWYEPFSKIRFLISWYEKSLWSIKEGTIEEIKEQKEYKEAEKRFQKIMDLVYKKTGENEWTS